MGRSGLGLVLTALTSDSTCSGVSFISSRIDTGD